MESNSNEAKHSEPLTSDSVEIFEGADLRHTGMKSPDSVVPGLYIFISCAPLHVLTRDSISIILSVYVFPSRRPCRYSLPALTCCVLSSTPCTCISPFMYTSKTVAKVLANLTQQNPSVYNRVLGETEAPFPEVHSFMHSVDFKHSCSASVRIHVATLLLIYFIIICVAVFSLHFPISRRPRLMAMRSTASAA